MRAIHILLILLIIILSGCTSVKVAKVFTKTTSSIKASVEKISDKRRKIKEKDNLILEDNLTQEIGHSTKLLSENLNSIESSIDLNTLVTGIGSYQMYKINKNTKSLN